MTKRSQTVEPPDVPVAPMQPAAEDSGFQERRHQFTLQYYNMAVRDLERHLGIGWQTIALVAGAAASWSLGYGGKLPLPIAVASAIAVGFWGLLNILDSNYWAARAIGFLANVESIYLYVDDAKTYNPYAGKHPPLKLLDSLKYQAYVAIAFILFSLVFYGEAILRRVEKFGGMPSSVEAVNTVTAAYYALPILVVLAGVNLVLNAYVGRIGDYLSFVVTAPGPGMLTTRGTDRPMDLVDAGLDKVSGEELQAELRARLSTRRDLWAKWAPWIRVSSAVLAAATVLTVVFKDSLIS